MNQDISTAPGTDTKQQRVELPKVSAFDVRKVSDEWEISWQTDEYDVEKLTFDPEAEDLDQWLEDTECRWSDDQRRELRSTFWPPQPLATIVHGNRELRDVLRDASQELRRHNNPPVLFQRGGELVHLAQNEDDVLSISRMSRPKMLERLSETSNWATPRGTATPPPNVIAQGMLDSMNGWNLPALRGIVENPVLRPNGSVLAKPGYDPTTGLFYRPTSDLRVRVPTSPTAEDRDHALAVVNEMIGEFPFANRASKVNALALMLTTILRPGITGPVPLAAITSPLPGSGKGLLAFCVSYVPTGRRAGFAQVPRNDENEWRKQLTATLIQGRSFIIYDNVGYPLDSSAFASVLTTTQWEDRILGTSKTVNLPVQATWVVTGNNLQLSRELGRRTYWIEIDAETDRPELREFNYDLEQWVPEHRAKVLSALLTLGRSWYVAGQPQYEVPKGLGSHVAWKSTVGNVLAHAGLEDFLGNLDDTYDAAEDQYSEWEPFIEMCAAVFSDRTFTVADVVRERHRFNDVLPPGMSDLDRDPDLTKKLRYGFRDHTNVTYSSGLKLERDGEAKKRREARWQVRRVRDPR